MKTRSFSLLLAVLLMGGLAACDEESSILAPDNTQQTEVELMVDEDITEAILTDAEAALDAVLGAPAASADQYGGMLFADPDPTLVEEARELLRQAREKFQEARRAWIGGDTELAAQLAMEGRLLVAEALVLVYGEEAYSELLERVDAVISWLQEQVDQDVSDLLARIEELRAEAEALRPTDLIAGTERLILAMHIAHRERTLHRRQEMAQHARLSLFMATSAVQLAGGIAGDDATDEQIHALRHAAHLLEDAARAFNAGRLRLSFVLSREVVNLSLVVVMLEPGIEGQRLEAMIELSNRAIAAAEEALAGSDPTEFAARLLEHAKNLQARALEIADIYPRRAIHVLWHSSVTAYGVIRLVN